MLNTYPGQISSTASSFVTFVGPPNVELTWVLEGAGTLTEVSTHSDSRGFGMAIFTPSDDNQQVTISVSYES